MSKKIIGQVLASTTEDRQGERYDKEFLEQLVSGMPQRVPLHQRHNLGLPSVGFITNQRVAPHPDVPGEWAILADVEINEDDVNANPDLKGFSWSATVSVARNADVPHFGHFVPFPAYKHGLLDEILNQDEPVLVGKWLKKELSPNAVSLLVGLMTLILTPIWDQTYKQVVWPHLSRQFDKLRECWWKKGASTDFMQMARLPSGDAVQIIFVPARQHEEQAFSRDVLDDGLQLANEAAIRQMDEGKVTSRIRLLFNERIGRWKVISIEFMDGSVLHIV
ncbi:hypothetical protein [Archangium sp. Cb G35]|uniref:hypothetical protein n=1 Tax=Archangium sp. Cb G35 TaxID=1920190 RepID=UPI0011611491|nr:hypothetical protein [Archangium sp. Cb G35]